MSNVFNAVASQYVPYLQDLNDEGIRRMILNTDRYRNDKSTPESREISFQNLRAVFVIESGRTYYKIVREQRNGGRSVHSFVVKEGVKCKFPAGTILKAETWSKPALNFARGNVLTATLPKGDTCSYGL